MNAPISLGRGLKIGGVVGLLLWGNLLVETPVSQKMVPVQGGSPAVEKEVISKEVFLEIGAHKSLYVTLEKSGISLKVINAIKRALPISIARKIRSGHKMRLVLENGALVSLKIYMGISRAWDMQPGQKGDWRGKILPIKVSATYKQFSIHVKDSFKKALMSSGVEKPLMGSIFRAFETSGIGLGNLRGKSISCMYHILRNDETKEVALNYLGVIQLRGKDRSCKTYYACRKDRKGNRLKLWTLADMGIGVIGRMTPSMSSWGRPVAGKITSGYGMRTHPVLGCKRHHKGVDFCGAYGCPIRAIASGVVKSVKNHSTYGKHVVIAHGPVYQTLYAHLSQSSVRVGQRVQRGQRIGGMGNSGRTRGVHLHLETLKNGKNIDPMCLIGSAHVVRAPRSVAITPAQKKYLLGQVNFLQGQLLKLGGNRPLPAAPMGQGRASVKKNHLGTRSVALGAKRKQSLRARHCVAKQSLSDSLRRKKRIG